MTTQVEALIKLGLDQATANQAITAIHQIDSASKEASRSLVKTGRDLREMGATMGLAGAAILGPLTAAASAYASKFGGLEATSRSYLAAQNNMTKASQDFGRVAATAVTPILNQLASTLESVAKFAAANPELVKIAAGGGMLLASLGATMAVAGQVITTIGKAKDFVSVALTNQSTVLNGLVGTLGKAALSVGLLVGTVDLTQTAIQAFGKATGDDYLANFDVIKTFRQALVDAAAGAITLISAVKVMGDQLTIAWNNAAKGIHDFLVKIGVEQATTNDQAGAALKAATDALNAANKNYGMGSPEAKKALSDYAVALSKAATSSNAYDDAIAAANKDIAQAGKDYKDAMAQLAKDAPHFVETGSFGGVVGTVANAVTGFLGGLLGKLGGMVGLGGGSTTTTGSGVNKTGLSPEAVNDFIAYQKAMRDSDRQFNQDKLAAQVEFQRSSKASEIAYQQDLKQAAIDYQRKQAEMARQHNLDMQQAEIDYQKQVAAEARQYQLAQVQAALDHQRGEQEAVRNHQEALRQNTIDYQRQVADAAKKFNQDRAQSELDYQRSQRDLAESRKNQDFMDSRDHQHRLRQLAMSGQVMGFIQEQQNYQYDQQTKTLQRTEEDKVNAQHQKDHLDDLQKQYDIERQQLDTDNQRKLDDMQTQFDNEAQQRQIAYDQQLSDLATQHNTTLANDQIAYQQQLTALNLKYSQDIQAGQIAYAQELTDKRVHHDQERQTALVAYQNQQNDLALHHQLEQDTIRRNFADQISQLQDNLFGLNSMRNNYMDQETTAAASFFSNNGAMWQNYFAQVTGLANSYLNPGSGSGGGSGGGGHYFATGLNYVPSDNYLAFLHRGERVLNAAENSQYNSAPRSGWTVNVQIGAVGEIVTPSQLQTVVDGVFKGVSSAIQRQGSFA